MTRVHGKGTLWGRMPGNDHVKAAGLRSLAYQWAYPGKQLLFMGQDASAPNGPRNAGLDWFQLDENKVLPAASRVRRRHQPASTAAPRAVGPRHQAGRLFRGSTPTTRQQRAELPAVRRDGSVVACVFNFAGSEHSRYRLGLPMRAPGEVLNTDATAYNGSGHRQPRRGGGHRRAVARPPGVGDGAAAAGAVVSNPAWFCSPPQTPTRRAPSADSSGVRSAAVAQYSALARLRRPATTSGSAGSNSSMSLDPGHRGSGHPGRAPDQARSTGRRPRVMSLVEDLTSAAANAASMSDGAASRATASGAAARTLQEVIWRSAPLASALVRVRVQIAW